MDTVRFDFIKLQEGFLYIKESAIASVEVEPTNPTRIAVTLTNGRNHWLTRKEDVNQILHLLDTCPITIEEPFLIPAREPIAAALNVPTDTFEADLQAVSYAKSGKRKGK